MFSLFQSTHLRSSICLSPDHIFTDFIFILIAEDVIPLDGNPELTSWMNIHGELTVGEKKWCEYECHLFRLEIAELAGE